MTRLRGRLSAWSLALGLAAQLGVASPARAEDRPSDAPVQKLAQRSEIAETEFPRHRYAFIAGGALFLGGLFFGYSAQGEALRAQSMSNARDSLRTLESAKANAATANLLYGLAGVTVAYALVLEFLPQQTAEKARFTFHF